MKSLLTSFFSFLKKEKFPTKENIIGIKDQPLSLYKSFLILSCLLVISLFLTILMSISNHFSIEKPESGGTLSFGVIGAPRFINPLLASSEVDKSLTYLTYSGLVKDFDRGVLEPVLASRFIVSPDGKEYRFTLKNGLMFSNKTPLTSSDVAFTFETKKRLALLADPASDWVDISIQTPDASTVIISTNGNVQSLIEKLSLGIVPKTLWGDISTENLKDSLLNMKPVGAGPYVIKDINYSNTIPKEVFLEINHHFNNQKPYIKKIKISIFSNQLALEDAVKNKSVEGTDMLSGTYIDTSMKNDLYITQVETGKSVSLFVNQQSQNSASGIALATLSPLIDRNKIIDIIENGYGIPLYNPLGTSTTDNEGIIGVLAKLGYKQNESGKLTKSGSEITISVAVRKDEQLLKAAEELSRELSLYGISTELKVFDQGLFAEQIREGSYQFILGTETDVPINYQNLIPLYKKVIPIITTKQIHLSLPSNLKTRDQIFNNIESWYMRTDKVWKWFK